MTRRPRRAPQTVPVTFHETWIDLPDGTAQGRSVRYRAGVTYTVTPDVAERACASGRGSRADAPTPAPLEELDGF